ncbi:sugar phosphate isomerase/epimerase [Lysinibacillus sphaericus]|uniref:Sugar phosphate isomerase/epimerase n=1 Tax=Lysinibacillus sphaericus TaxID=1421 RepID=A0A544V0H4_LYSSH|nr:sugar phosphate isomerase/epimerase [Lysinibacillus sp. SDF0037]TQR39597.1 sugar phosphate isomerase/epimerase [Lysinibacillus sp. SDF0037]
MNIFASSTLFWGQSLEEICQKVQVAQLQGIELWVEQMILADWSIGTIEKELQQSGLALTLHARSWDLNIASLNEEIRQASVQDVVRTLLIAKALDVPSITVHPGRKMIANHSVNLYKVAMQRSLQTLYEASEKIGVQLSIELMEHTPKELYWQANMLNTLIKQYPTFRTTFDIAHIDIGISIEQELQQLHAIDKIHISDSTSLQYHVALGTGELQLTPSLWTMIEQLEVPVVIEGLCYDDTLFQQHLNYLEKVGVIQRELFTYKR